MQTKVPAQQANQNQAHGEKVSSELAQAQFEDCRPEATAQLSMQSLMADSAQTTQLKSTQAMMAAKPDSTGLPNQLKAGIESLSGINMDSVRVHYNSDKPAQLQAHAYAQGSDIHVAPGQEKHLPHEAWHVVQQAQGRVQPTTQMKGKVDINDDVALEAEADVMGAKAVAQGAGISTETGAVDNEQSLVSSSASSIQRAVVQRRLPAMSAEQIAAEPKVAAELLVHSLRNLKGASLTTYFAQAAEAAATARDAWITYLQGTPSLEQIGVLATSMNASAAVPAYAIEPNAQTALTVEVQTAVGLQLASVVAGLGTTIANTDLLKSIMGVGDDRVGIAVAVLTQARTAIQAHIDAGTCPLVIGGNREHNLWTGVGGMTTHGAAQVQLGQSSVNSLAAGGAPGKAALVHEFTHAAANTADHAYTTEACYGLSPAKRLNNATTYEHAYLEATSAADRQRHYDPENAVHAADGAELGAVPAARLRAARGAAELASEVWNNVDNAYIQARLIAGGQDRTPLRLGISALATYPYTPMTREATYGMGLALIEDRTKMLIGLKKAGGHRPVLRGYDDVDVLDGLLPYEVLGKSIAALGIMSESDAMQWVIWLEKAPAMESFLREKRSTYM